ncbi:MAG: hypothetical protein CMI60_12070 [Parvibaculum sp.]|nr:hypothetical protein [Parvibaculum sp.]
MRRALPAFFLFRHFQVQWTRLTERKCDYGNMSAPENKPLAFNAKRFLIRLDQPKNLLYSETYLNSFRS